MNVLCLETRPNAFITTTLASSLLLFWNKTDLAVTLVFAWWSELLHAEGQMEDFHKLLDKKWQQYCWGGLIGLLFNTDDLIITVAVVCLIGTKSPSRPEFQDALHTATKHTHFRSKQKCSIINPASAICDFLNWLLPCITLLENHDFIVCVYYKLLYFKWTGWVFRDMGGSRSLVQYCCSSCHLSVELDGNHRLHNTPLAKWLI